MIGQSSGIAPPSERNRLETARHATAAPRSTGYAGAVNSDQGKGVLRMPELEEDTVVISPEDIEVRSLPTK